MPHSNEDFNDIPDSYHRTTARYPVAAKVVLDDGDQVYVDPRLVLQQPLPSVAREEKRYKGISGRLFVDLLAAIAILMAVLFGLLAGVGVFDKDSKQSDNNPLVDGGVRGNTTNAALRGNTNAPNPSPVDSSVAAPVASPVASPVATPVANDPDDSTSIFSDPPFDVNGDGNILVYQCIDVSKQTVTVRMEYAGEAWLGFAFSESGAMFPNVATIGLPDDNTVLKHGLNSKNAAEILPLDAALQTLTDTSIMQENGKTVLQFTKNLDDNGEVSANLGTETRFNWAVGSGNELGFHELFGSSLLAFTECVGEAVEDKEATPTSAPAAPIVDATPTAAPTAAVSNATEAPNDESTAAPVTLSPILDCSTLDEVNVTDDGSMVLRHVIDSVGQTVTVELEYFGQAWLGFVFSETGSMIPNVAVIGLPDDGSVRKYNLAGMSTAEVLPLDDALQTLSDASIEQTDESTILKFTRKLVEAGEVDVIVGENRFNWAIGADNTFARHLERGSKVANFDECRDVENPADGESIAPTPSQTQNDAITYEPTWAPTGKPVEASPTWKPTYAPVAAKPTWPPTYAPIAVESWPPTYAPAAKPTWPPTYAPTYAPTDKPTWKPTWAPTNKPTWPPTWAPTWKPPTWAPTWAPVWNPPADDNKPVGYGY